MASSKTLSRSYIVTGPCQSQKSWTAFNVIDELMRDVTEKTCGCDCVFITQANNSRIVQQTIGRMKKDERISQHFDRFQYISTKGCDLVGGVVDNNGMYVGFWHSNTKENVLKLLGEDARRDRILVVDEIEQGGFVGVRERMEFVLNIMARQKGRLHVVLITATIANLSKCVGRLAEGLKGDKAFEELLDREWDVRHVAVSDSYVGMKWYMDNGLVRTISLPKTHGDARVGAVICAIREHVIEDDQRKLALICASSRTGDHSAISDALLMAGMFNVCIELNSGELSKTYNVKFMNGDGEIRVWPLPYEKLGARVKSGGLASVIDAGSGRRIKTHWSAGSIPPLPYILQAALRMGTEWHGEIREMVTDDVEWASLVALLGCVNRPDDYPERPLVAVVAGNMASRGMTLTSAQCAFVYSMYLFGDTPDGGQRGAANTQRAGRSYGNVLKLCEKIRPVVLATERCVIDALANEVVSSGVLEKSVVRLGDLVSEEEWDEARVEAIGASGYEVKKTKTEMPTKRIEAKYDLRPVRGKAITQDAPLVTTFERMPLAQFVEKYISVEKRQGVLSGVIGTRTIPGCVAAGFSANCSFTRNSSSKVANLRNYYIHPEWSGKEYHFVWNDARNMVSVIQRDKSVLDQDTLPPFLAAHDDNGNVVVYSVKIKN